MALKDIENLVITINAVFMCIMEFCKCLDKNKVRRLS